MLYYIIWMHALDWKERERERGKVINQGYELMWARSHSMAPTLLPLYVINFAWLVLILSVRRVLGRRTGPHYPYLMPSDYLSLSYDMGIL
jgi:hypothetical protein